MKSCSTTCADREDAPDQFLLVAEGYLAHLQWAEELWDKFSPSSQHDRTWPTVALELDVEKSQGWQELAPWSTWNFSWRATTGRDKNCPIRPLEIVACETMVHLHYTMCRPVTGISCYTYTSYVRLVSLLGILDLLLKYVKLFMYFYKTTASRQGRGEVYTGFWWGDLREETTWKTQA
jgi:hypothetical protein